QRGCDAWQRQRYSSARCKMQKLSAERFHGRCSTNSALLRANNNIEKRPECLLLAQSGHPDALNQCPLSGVERTWAELSAQRYPGFVLRKAQTCHNKARA